MRGDDVCVRCDSVCVRMCNDVILSLQMFQLSIRSSSDALTQKMCTIFIGAFFVPF